MRQADIRAAISCGSDGQSAPGLSSRPPFPVAATTASPRRALPEETFVQPPILESVAGLLSVTLRLAYLPTVLNGKAVTLRAMNERIPAPTLRIKVGDTLRILVDNQFPPNPPSTEPVQHLRYPNSTNLHTHGLHVTPGLVAPGVYGDYVVDDPKLGIQPGQVRQHEYRIGLDHPPGAYWYHPHLHGSTAIQVGSGMAGALIIKGDIDRVPEIAAASERVFVFQAPISDATGTLESFTQVADSPGLEGPFLINGVRRPRIVMQRGEVQNWHFINAAIFNFVNLRLDDHALNVYSHDGNPRREHARSRTRAGRMASCSRPAIARARWSRQARQVPTSYARCDSRWARGSPSWKRTCLPTSSWSILRSPCGCRRDRFRSRRPRIDHRRRTGERGRPQANHRPAQRLQRQ